MSDEWRALVALVTSVLTAVGTALFTVWRWRGDRRDKQDDSWSKDRGLHEAMIRKDFEFYHQEWRRADERCDMWERRYWAIERIAHSLHHHLNNDRLIASVLLEKAGQPAPAWPANPPIPRPEEL